MGKTTIGNKATACVCALALAFAIPLSLGLPPIQQAQAVPAEEQVWTLVGTELVYDQDDGKYYTTLAATDGHYEEQILSDYKVFDSSVINNYRYPGMSYVRSYTWSRPPETIPLGQEDSVTITMVTSIESFSYDSSPPDLSIQNNDRAPEATRGDVYICYCGPYDPNGSSYEFFDTEHATSDAYLERYYYTSSSLQYKKDHLVVKTEGQTRFADFEDSVDSGHQHHKITASTNEDGSIKGWSPASRTEEWSFDRQMAIYNKVARNQGADGYLMAVFVNCYNMSAYYYYTLIPQPVEATSTTEQNGQNVSVETVAPNTPGDFGSTSSSAPGSSSSSSSGGTSGNTPGSVPGWVIPAVIVGVAVVGVGVASARRGRKPKGELPPDKGSSAKQEQEEEEPPKPSTYRMVLWKNFGDTLYAGGTAQTVGARIEEVKPGGTVVQRSDLTARITFATSENIAATAVGMKGANQCIEARAASAEASTGVISVKFTGEGGTFTNNVTFKIDTLEIVFPDVPLTFVAGKKQTFQMPFRFSQGDIATKGDPIFTVKLTGSRANENFMYKRVVHDTQFPDKLFAVELAEFGPVSKDDVPGTMEDYLCEVEAKLPAAANEPEIVVNGQFHFFRFFEGLRFTCEPLKCYLVKHVENDDTYLSGTDALDMALDAQAKAVGLAGGLVTGIGVQASQRGTARELKERFPEVYKEDDAYLYDKRDKVMLTPGRTHAYATLYVVEMYAGPDGRTFQRPCTPLPKRDDVQLAFADVPGSSVLVDKDGKETAGPVDTLEFVSFVSDIKRTDNTVTFEILPTKGVMTPPNRSQVDVTCVVTWTDQTGNERTFMETQRVNAISQPYRIDYEEKFKEYQAGDDEVQDMLRSIQAKILNSDKYRGGLAKKASVSLTEAAMDGMADAYYDGDNKTMYYTLKLNPITGIGIGLYELYKGTVGFARSINRQRDSDVYFDDLTPIAYRIESMIEGHDYAFGFFEPEVKQVVTTFARFESGELGSAEAIDLAYHGRDMLFADTLRMTVQDWNHSWTAIGVRIGFAFITFGESEWLFMPLAAISAGMEGSLNYIDNGGDDLLEAYRVGCSDAGKQLLFEGAMAVGVGAAVKCVKWAGVLTKEAIQQRQLYAKALSEMFSSAKYSKAVLGAANAVETLITKSRSLAQTAMHTALKPFRSAANALMERLAGASADKVDDIIRTYRGGATVGAENVEREIAYVLGRMEGSVKVDALKQLMKSGGKGLSIYEKRAVVIAIQSDKHAMRTMLEAGDKEVIAFFNEIMGDIEKKAIQKAREALYSRFGGKVPMDKIRVKGTSGNVAADVIAGRKLPMDLDVTFEYWDDVAGAYKDVKAALGQECFDAEFYKICKGYAAESDDVARLFARNADMTVTDAFHAEAYSAEYRDALRVIDKNLAGERFTNAKQVGKVAEYKCVEWLQLSKRALADSRTARAAGKIVDAQGLAALSEAYAEEAVRQFTKQADRLVVNRLSYLYSKGITPSTSVNIDSFLSKVAVLKRSGMGRFGGTGLTAGEIDAVLEGGFQTNVETLYHELNVLTVELDNALNAVAK